MEKKRIRSQNYTSNEKEILLSILSKYRNIIENKKTDAISVNDKSNTWKNITQEYNAQCPNFCYRAEESLKKFYDNQKKAIRKKVGSQRTEMYQTGGGTTETKLNAEDMLLLSIVNKKTIYGLENAYDNDIIPSTTEHAYSQILNIDEVLEIDIENKDVDQATCDNNVQNENVEISGHNWKRYKPSNLQEPISTCLSGNHRQTGKPPQKSSDASRRRPAIVKTFTSSTLGEKYEQLLDKKLEYVQCLRKEHDLRCELLALDIEMKKKQLQD